MKNIKNELEEYNKILKEETNEVTRKLINEISDVMDKDEQIRGRIPEDMFVDNFLNYFKNIKDAKPEQDPLMHQWINISGSVYNEVELVDKAGNIVAIIPPLISKSAIALDKLDNVEFCEIGEHYKLLSANDGIRAHNFVTTELSQLPKCIDKQSTEGYASRWVRIFERYSDKKDNSEEVKHASKKIKEDLGIDYDAD